MKLKLSQQFHSGVQEGDNWLHHSNSTKTGTNLNIDSSSGVAAQINLNDAEKPLIENCDDAASKKLFTPVINDRFMPMYQNEDRKSLRSPLLVPDSMREKSLMTDNKVEIHQIPPLNMSS